MIPKSMSSTRSGMGPVFGQDHALICVSGGDFAGDFGAFVEITANCEVGGRCAGAISLLKTPVTTIETGHDLAPPLAIRRLGVDQRLHLVTPSLPFIGP